MQARWSSPLRERKDFEHALVQLVQPLGDLQSPGFARLRLGETATMQGQDADEMEGFCRRLWGLFPFARGGGEFEGWNEIRTGLVNGTHPDHPEYWGTPGDHDQRLAELAAIAFGLCLVPEILWEPLTATEKASVSAYLSGANRRQVPDNNWIFFRVLLSLALERIGAQHDAHAREADLDRLDTFYLGDGWYSDGPTQQRDYYVAFAMHFYALLYAQFAADIDPVRCARYRERAARFAQDFIHWFAADGSALPFGRSLNYRFAQGAFWGALAFAGVEAFPWGVIKGIVLRHLRWWLSQPIFSANGLLTIGYAYPNLNSAEQYISPASPYWALKLFLPLALPETHPFWQAAELPLPDLPKQVAQTHAHMIICRADDGNHVFALNGGQWATWLPRHGPEKYAKFCYSTCFGFSICADNQGLSLGAHDNTLVVSDDGVYFRGRGMVEDLKVSAQAIESTWRPFADVTITTWLIPAGAWHVRVQRLRSGRTLVSAEGGFALRRDGKGVAPAKSTDPAVKGSVKASSRAGMSLIHDFLDQRAGSIVHAAPNTNLLHPRTVIPMLTSHHDAGESWLACAVVGIPADSNATTIRNQMPACRLSQHGFNVVDHEGKPLHSWRS
jgi:hypothetical protein